VKLVIEKLGGLRLTMAGLELIRACGMEPVIVNGAANDITLLKAVFVAETITSVDRNVDFHKPLPAS
jgi:hypothetical protein